MYFKHLFKNWKVAFHALLDFIAHFVHGLFPFIKIKHHQPTNCANKNMNTQPIKHGKWVCVGHDGTTYWYRCSSCGHEEHDNRKDKIKELEEYLNRAYELLDEIKEEEKIKVASEKNVLQNYRSALCCEGHNYYAINVYNDILDDKVCTEIDKPSSLAFDRCPYYPTKELAEQSLELKSFNDKLLAFKYCYDLEYVPDWEDETEKKYYIFMHHEYGERYFDYDCAVSYAHYTTFFSSEEIAEKCCDWLNNELKEGEIII